MIDSINKSNTIINAVEKSRNILGSNSYFGILFCGIISGSGSSIISDIFNINNSKIFTLQKPDILENLSTVFKFSVFASMSTIILDHYQFYIPHFQNIKSATLFLLITVIKFFTPPRHFKK